MFSTAKVRRKRWQDKRKIPTAQLRRRGWVSTVARSVGRADGKIIIGKVIHRGMERNKAGELKDEGVNSIFFGHM